MKWMCSRVLIAIIVATMGVPLPGPSVSARNAKAHKYRYSEIDMPVSLAVGTVRTPEFPGKHEAYFIMIQAQKGHLPFVDMKCMMGLLSGPLDKKDCPQEPLLQAGWTVWADGKVIAQGSTPDRCACEFTDKYLFKIFGPFVGESGKKYVVEMKFTKDGTQLNATNPHLIVILVRNH
jgi:hypothetical protein